MLLACNTPSRMSTSHNPVMRPSNRKGLQFFKLLTLALCTNISSIDHSQQCRATHMC